eukprot:CAMPEP_0174315970 /NCGR_PEP_ID=MMETSP0810-20121108/6623_1 /TAXON_ID=73025 ORGANISM="Eutreptiella gymnastica-like, Strain CCMP1594" /NCGR_SAMPLE_ID=MMETSP0810 /ASSEMBLY_ACC=CAM_ASM_000659 /LENGTH=345 /DNA_ID=CAMNT_0015425497 /DNA_START=379 /DNA_END=1417 /DNA_ORIENTATION=+
MQAFLKNMVLPPPTPPTHTRIPLAQRPAMFRRCTTSDCPSGRVGKEAALTDAPLGGHRTGGPLRKGDQGAGPPALPLAPVRSSLLKSLHVESEGAVYQERPTHAIARRPQPVAPSTLLRARTRLPGAAITPAKRSELDYADAALSRGSVTQPQPMQYSTPFHANAHVWSHTPVVMVEAIASGITATTVSSRHGGRTVRCGARAVQKRPQGTLLRTHAFASAASPSEGAVPAARTGDELDPPPTEASLAAAPACPAHRGRLVQQTRPQFSLCRVPRSGVPRAPLPCRPPPAPQPPSRPPLCNTRAPEAVPCNTPAGVELLPSAAAEAVGMSCPALSSSVLVCSPDH